MKIAAFYSDSPFASWSQSRGFGAVLRRMGHDVTEIMVPPVKTVTRTQVEKINKPIEDCELILVSGPEHLKDWINQFYPQWDKLKAPKVGWYHESFEAREDYKLCYQNYERMFDFHFFPDKDDAEKFKGSWLPLGVDTAIFEPRGWDNDHGFIDAPRDIDSAFIGLMYPKRARFYEDLKPFLKDLRIRVANGNILVHDFDGINLEESTELLARTYRRIKVFVAFPSVCNVLVAKILESMACGCYLVAPKQPVELSNYASYETPKHCAKEIRHALELADYRERIALQGCDEVNKNHRMEQRFEQIFKITGAKECVSALPEPAASSGIISAAV